MSTTHHHIPYVKVYDLLLRSAIGATGVVSGFAGVDGVGAGLVGLAGVLLDDDVSDEVLDEEEDSGFTGVVAGAAAGCFMGVVAGAAAVNTWECIITLRRYERIEIKRYSCV